MSTETVSYRNTICLSSTGPRPHSLNLCSKVKVISPHTQPHREYKMASFDSIGSCSIDAEAPPNRSPVTYDTVDRSVSQRTLHSMSVEDPQSDPHARSLRSPDVVQEAMRILTSSKRDTLEKKPSYLGLSCAISGYNRLTNYGGPGKLPSLSKSRDASPGRLIDIDASVTEPLEFNNGVLNPSRVSQLKKQLQNSMGNNKENGLDRGRQASIKRRELNSKNKAGQSRSISMDRGYLRKYCTESTFYVNGAVTTHGGLASVGKENRNAYSKPSVKVLRTPVVERDEVRRVNGGVLTTRQAVTVDHGGEYSVNVRTEEESLVGPGKSFIQQRIERLYGPSALCSGFRLRRSKIEESSRSEVGPLTGGSDVTVSHVRRSDASLPVFRHLRAEFREQLPVRKKTKDEITQVLLSQSSTLVPAPTTAAAAAAAAPTGLRTDLPPPKTSPISQVHTADTQGEVNGAVEEKAGHKFKKILDAECVRIQRMVETLEEDLKCAAPSEEVGGKMLAAIGKAKLLMAQKFEQFRGLCDKNINDGPSEQFPTTAEDLAGFWDMVLIQVDHINQLFAELDIMRKNNWQEVKASPACRKQATASTKKAAGRKATTSTSKSSAATSEATRARQEARKKMMEEKRRRMKEKKEEEKDGDIIIFVPEGK